ncbi:MAG: hypothetical protein E7649_03565 [Ruminococcaceae bacterium]|nr:hypothetical protein [Oscillospiraceae bacterium]
MRFSKVLAALLVLIMILSAISCDINFEETEKTTEETTKEATTEATTETTAEGTTDQPDETETEVDYDDPQVDLITIAEALELCGNEGNITEERYYIRATVKTITNPQYGAMVIADETGEISVYGTYSSDGSLAFPEMDETPVKGDEVILHCILQNYNGTKEVKNARLIWFKSNQGNFDVSQYKTATIAEAREAATGEKLLVSGVVARITYANGYKPSGFILVEGGESIYVYNNDAAGQVEIGNRVTVAASKTYWILESESSNAAKHGYKGCNQLEDATVVENDKGNNEWINSAIPTSTVKEIMDTPVSEDITTKIFKVTALIKKAPGKGFVNYYINDLDEKTGSYTYTQCNGGDFDWLDEFDGKICTVYMVALNAKSTVSDCVYRFLPVAVNDEGFTFNTENAAEFAVKYHGVTQFEKLYTGDPSLELVGCVSSELLGFEGATLTYSSSDDGVVSFTGTDSIPESIFMHCHNTGSATVTVTGQYGGKTYSETVTVSVKISDEIPAITVGEAIGAPVGEVITVKGIVGPSLVNQSGFYLIDETGVIAVILSDAELEKVQLGHEVILKGTRATRLKDGATVFGQTNLDGCEILVNNYGDQEYSTATFIEGKTPEEFYALDANEDHGTEVYVLTVTVEVVESAYYTNINLVSGGTKIGLYCSSANQYNWLKAYAGQQVTVEVAPCNWNAKSYYRGCVLAVRHADGTKTCNELNFSK